MPKLFGKNVPPVVMGGVGLVVFYLAYTTLFPSDDTTVSTRKARPPVKKSSGQTDYLTTDYTFTVPPLPDTVTPKDAFKPLVSKQPVSVLGGIPSIDNYTYSGMAELNNVANGLLENGQTGQGDFVQPGERWHGQYTVIKVNADEIQLRNDNGDITTMLAGAAAAKAAMAAAGPGPAAAAAATGNPVMVGPIGANDLSVQADTTVQPQQGGGRRRGRRGGGGGGGAPPAGG